MSRNGPRSRVLPALIGVVAVAYLLLIVGLPVATIFRQAFAEGGRAFIDALRDDNAQAALRMTAKTCAIVVPLNTIFGIAAAWVLARHRFLGKSVLAAFVNLPLALAPTITGLLIVLVYSPTIGLFHAPLASSGVQILFALPGVVIATMLVTLPLVALEVLPSLEQLDATETQAARTLGATSWQAFRRVVLPAIRWSVAYGIVLCCARSAGEYGAVESVSGRMAGETMTLTQHIAQSYEDFESTKAFAASTLLAGLAVFTLFVNVLLTHQQAKRGAK